MSLAVYEQNGNARALAERDTFEVIGPAAELAKKLAMTEFVPTGLRNRPEAVMAAILTGHEIGLPPMASLSNIHVIEGKPTLSAQAMRALVLSKGHDIDFQEMTISRVTIVGRRRGSDHSTPVTYTMDDARRAQLANRQNWQKFPRQMLMARATGELCRAIFSDVLGGIAYTTEEMQDGGGFIDGQATEEEKPEQPKTRRRIRQEEPAAEAPAAEPPPQGSEPQPPPEPPLPEAEPPAAEPLASEPVEGEAMKLSQQLAMACREAGINRVTLVKAFTGKESGSKLSRTEAIEAIDIARKIQRGEMRFEMVDGGWAVIPVDEMPLPLESE